ncbi:hypothetical protein [Glycomyces algeriensis]|nr:hypothetical protein [Glycomyces algeriensis]MDA1368913.1 hypothetical protein [Glycomyces algeriensis]MDR7352813.1 hypothetical protein [Glycomyces algeriensis]
MVRDYLEGLAGEDPARQALADFLDLADQVSASSGPEGHNWSREDLYER